MSVLLRAGVQSRIHSTIFSVRPTLKSAGKRQSFDRLREAKKNFYSKNASLKRVRDRKVIRVSLLVLFLLFSLIEVVHRLGLILANN